MFVTLTFDFKERCLIQEESRLSVVVGQDQLGIPEEVENVTKTFAVSVKKVTMLGMVHHDRLCPVEHFCQLCIRKSG